MKTSREQDSLSSPLFLNFSGSRTRACAGGFCLRLEVLETGKENLEGGFRNPEGRALLASSGREPRLRAVDVPRATTRGVSLAPPMAGGGPSGPGLGRGSAACQLPGRLGKPAKLPRAPWEEAAGLRCPPRGGPAPSRGRFCPWSPWLERHRPQSWLVSTRRVREPNVIH